MSEHEAAVTAVRVDAAGCGRTDVAIAAILVARAHADVAVATVAVGEAVVEGTVAAAAVIARASCSRHRWRKIAECPLGKGDGRRGARLRRRTVLGRRACGPSAPIDGVGGPSASTDGAAAARDHAGEGREEGDGTTWPHRTSLPRTACRARSVSQACPGWPRPTARGKMRRVSTGASTFVRRYLRPRRRSDSGRLRRKTLRQRR